MLKGTIQKTDFMNILKRNNVLEPKRVFFPERSGVVIIVDTTVIRVAFHENYVEPKKEKLANFTVDPCS